MATAGDGRAPSESGGAGEKFCKRLLLQENNGDLQNVSRESGQNSTVASEESTHQAGDSVSFGKSELKQRSETQQLIALLHSRTIEDSPSPLFRLEASTTSESVKNHKFGDKRDNVHSSIVIPRVLEEKIASPSDLANAYKGGCIIATGQALRQDLKLIDNKATCLSKISMALRPQHPATMENLPDELLSNIFIRLLAKEVAQMRSVSKSWNALLSESSFIKSHLDRSIHNNDQVLLVFNHPKENKIFTAHPCQSLYIELTNFIKLPINPRPEYTDGITVIGSINGLICSSYGGSVIQIWNPSLSAVLTLPPYSMPSHRYDYFYFRFGFDPKTNDYKVVKLTGLIRQQYAIRPWLQVEIYSMRRGSWEVITGRIPSHITWISTDDGVCADGHDGYLHWRGYTDGKSIWDRILAFDLGSGTFHEIPLPDSIPVFKRVKHLGILDGKLCVMSWIRNDPCEVWVMEEYGVAESWVKRLVFSRFTGDTHPYGFTSHNELLFKDDSSSLVLCDPIANKGRFFNSFCYAYDRPQKIVKYVDSLVWITPIVREMVDDA